MIQKSKEKKKREVYLFRMFFLMLISMSGLLKTEMLMAQTITQTNVSSVVLDENNEPLVGATILIKGSSIGTVTDVNGFFKLAVPAGSTIVVSSIGYKTVEIPIDKVGSKITLYENVKSLDEVVVIGYGTTTKSDLTGSVGVIRVKDIEGLPVTRIDQMLQGRISGVDVMSTDGEPGSGTSIRIRGTRSISASNEPLYVVDGVVDGITTLSDINPDDVQSLQVLKDASSTAIYGSRAANGVVVITTKEGREGKTVYKFSTRLGFSELPRYLDLMNATEFATLYNDYKSLPVNILSTNTNGAPTKMLESLAYPDPLSLGEGTNWTKEVTRIAPYNDYQFSASGGFKTLNYYFSTNYNRNEGIIKNTGSERILTRLNITNTLNKYFKTGVRLNYSNQIQRKNTVVIGSFASANVNAVISLPPVMSVYKEDGSYNDWNPIFGGKGGYVDSPVAIADLSKWGVNIKSMTSDMFLEYRPNNKLLLKSTFSYQNYHRVDDVFIPSTMPTRTIREQGSYARQYWFEANNLLNENTIMYKNKLKKHAFDCLYGFTFQQRDKRNLFLGGSGYTSDAVEVYDMGGIPSKENYEAGSSTTTLLVLSNLMRINYNYDSKYYLTATARGDGSSNFAKGNKWALFPSVALKWNIKKENFMKSLSAINEFSLRTSAGLAGNQGIDPYASLTQMVSYSNGYIFNGAIPGSYYLSQVSNSKLTWEKTTSYNLGIDLSFLQRKIVLTADAYMAHTRDLLLRVQLPVQTGSSWRLENVGKTSNSGIELSVTSYNISKLNFSWNTVFTVSHNRQMVLDAGGYDRIATYTPNASYTYEMYGYKQGYPVNALWGMVYAGTWKNKEEIEQNAITKEYVSKTPGFTDLGWPKYVDQNKDGKLDREDIVYLGNSDPILFGGIQNSFNIYGFSLMFYFNYSIGGKIFNPLELSMGSGDYQTSQYRYMTNAWHPVRNPDSDYPRANAKDFVVSTYQMHDASFLRLKDASIAYTFFLAKYTNKMINKLTLSASGNNLLLWKYYNGFDPEVSSPNETRRLDLGAYPNSRTIIFGVNVEF